MAYHSALSGCTEYMVIIMLGRQCAERRESVGGIMLGKRVLLIEETVEIADSTRAFLGKAGIVPTVAFNIQSAISQMMIRSFDVVALDMDTEDSARLIGLLLDLRHAKNTLLLIFPVVDADNRATFMNRGFDMCLTGSSPRECSAAVCALLRRPSADEYPAETAPPGRIIYKDLTMDPLRQRVTMRGSQIPFTAMEFKLLYFLASNPSIVFSRELIYERVWRESSLYGSKSVNDLICSVRRKLGLSPQDSDYIKTIKGVGYCFAP